MDRRLDDQASATARWRLGPVRAAALTERRDDRHRLRQLKPRLNGRAGGGKLLRWRPDREIGHPGGASVLSAQDRGEFGFEIRIPARA